VKTAGSIPELLFEVAEQFAKRVKMSRSELYAAALQEYLQAHRRNRVTERLDAVYANEDSSLDPLFVQLQAHTLSEDW
jgi:metal-responsive CopG/Arc/MetJ family transcriptional regulator